MSLVAAAHDGREIVIASDGLSTSTKTGVKAADGTIQKVRQIHSRLALAVTGRFASDKLPFFSNFISVVSDETGLDAALDKLFEMAVAYMKIHQTEGFRMSLIGFNGDEPGFRSVDVEKGKGFTALGELGRNYWVSGDYDPVEHALRLIEKSNIGTKPSGAKLETTLRSIITECIGHYPQILGSPVNVFRLR